MTHAGRVDGPLPLRRITVSLYALFLATGALQSAILPLLPGLGQRYRLSATEAGLLLAAPSVGVLVVSAAVGVLADRLGSRRVALVGAWMIALSALAQAMPSLALLFVGRITFGFAFGVVWTAGLAWLAQAQPGGNSEVLGGAVTSAAIGMVGGPLAAALVGKAVGLWAPFAAAACLLAVVCAALHATPAAVAGADARAGYSLRQLASQLRDRPGVLDPAWSLALVGAATGTTQLLAPFAFKRAGMSVSSIGAAFSAAGALYILVSGLVARLGARAATLRVNGLAVLCIAVACVPAAQSAATLAVVASLLLLALPRAAISTIAYPLASRDTAMFGRPGAAIGVLNGTWAAAMLVAPIAAGMLLQSSGLRLPYLVLVVISAASGLVLLHRTSGGDHSARSRSASDLHAELSGGPDDSASADVSAAMAEPVFSADVLKGAATPR